MGRQALAFLGGTLLVTWFPQLPSFWLAALLAVLSLGLFFVLPDNGLTWYSWWIAFALGFSWCLYQADRVLSSTWPSALESQTLTLMGTIVSIPVARSNIVRFEYDIDHVETACKLNYPLRVRLSYYRHGNKSSYNFQLGQRWRLVARLKRPRGFWNPGSFDYQAWLFQNRLCATGYIVDRIEPLFLGNRFYPLGRMRSKVADLVSSQLHSYPLAGLVNALVTGVRHAVSEEQWEVMRGTGTNHLFAIAGLHVGFVAGLTYWIAQFFWRCSSRLPLFCPASQVGLVAALIGAAAYSALSGFSLPTQRALIMLVVFSLGKFARRRMLAWDGWYTALLIILIGDPLAVLNESFWLSFGAVGCLIYSLSGRVKAYTWGWKWIKTQWATAVGLVPLSLLFFQQIPLAGVLANTIAVPWVGLFVLPLCLLGVFFSLISRQVGKVILVLSERLLEWVWWPLSKMASLGALQWYGCLDGTWSLLVAIVSVGLLLMPRGLPGRCMGIIWFLPLVFNKPVAPKAGEIWFTLLDVGQGLSAVIRTHQHTLVYDTGPKMGTDLDAGSAVVLPFLRHLGVHHIDGLVISHPDSDHRGGLNSLLKHMPVSKFMTSTPDKFSGLHPCLCKAGQQWDWDGVHFEMLYPASGYYGRDNDSSCVLKVNNGCYSLLLPGDIQSIGEAALVSRSRGNLHATILVAPHHGSKTSSHARLIDAVQPGYVLFAVGYRNRFGFPHAQVVNRYQTRGVQWYSTARDGAITFRLGDHQLSVETYHKSCSPFWQT